MNTKHYQVILSFSCALAAILAYAVKLIPLTNTLLLFIFILGCYLLTHIQNAPTSRYFFTWSATLLIGFFIAVYKPEGFKYPIIWNFGSLYERGSPYTLHLNFSKALGGFIVVIWLLNHATKNTRKAPLIWTALISLATAICILISAKLLLSLQWEPKLPQGVFYFVLVNLLVTSLSEEAFFRLFIQRKISIVLSKLRYEKLIVLSVTSVLFAFTHTPILNIYWGVYFLAGLGYGLIFLTTGRFFTVVSVHFSVNLIHFLLLEYPLADG